MSQLFDPGAQKSALAKCQSPMRTSEVGAFDDAARAHAAMSASGTSLHSADPSGMAAKSQELLAAADPDPVIPDQRNERLLPPIAAIPISGSSIVSVYHRYWVDCVEKLYGAIPVVILLLSAPNRDNDDTLLCF